MDVSGCGFGAGRDVQNAQVVEAGSVASLCCPVMGSPELAVAWRRFVYDEYGRPREEALDPETDQDITIKCVLLRCMLSL